MVGYDGATSVRIVGLASGDLVQALAPDAWRFSGKPLAVARGAAVSI